MQIVTVDKKRIKQFIDFPDTLYRDDDMYVPYMKGDLKKTLVKLLITDGTYKALLALNDRRKAIGRVLFTISRNKQLDTDKCGFFCMYECVDDEEVSSALLSRMKEMLAEMGAEYISGPYFPYDPDNRRGFVVQGFTPEPLIFTSYNPYYYNRQFTDFGFEKDTDTFQYCLDHSTGHYEKLRKLGAYACTRYGIRVDTVDWKMLDRDIRDFTSVMKQATNDINYQSAPEEAEIRAILQNWKFFLNKDLILIARREEDNAPVGLVMAIPDFFQLFRKMKGRLGLRGILILLFGRKRIRSIRAMLQYVIPEYQSRGIAVSMYAKLLEMVTKNRIEHIEAGTIVENNQQSNSAIKAIGGYLSRVYRIYTLKIGENKQ